MGNGETVHTIFAPDITLQSLRDLELFGLRKYPRAHAQTQAAIG